jgi:hypothetical protein
MRLNKVVTIPSSLCVRGMDKRGNIRHLVCPGGKVQGPMIVKIGTPRIRCDTEMPMSWLGFWWTQHLWQASRLVLQESVLHMKIESIRVTRILMIDGLWILQGITRTVAQLRPQLVERLALVLILRHLWDAARKLAVQRVVPRRACRL